MLTAERESPRPQTVAVNGVCEQSRQDRLREGHQATTGNQLPWSCSFHLGSDFLGFCTFLSIRFLLCLHV